MMKYKLIFLWAIIITAAVNAKPTTEAVKAAEKHREESRLIVKLIESLHYKDSDLNDEFSSQILDKYFAILDPNKMYFMSKDVLAFEKWRTEIDDFLKQGKVEPAFEIFNLFKKRVQQRTDFALKQLEQPLDFSKSERYHWNREKAEWPIDEKSIDEVWRKKVKNDYLNLKLTDKKPEEIKKILRKRYKLMAKRIKERKSDDVFQYFINAYVGLVEPHTGYMAPRTSENFAINMSLSLEGIGAVLSVDGEYTTVETIVKGGPADLEGSLKKGYKLVAVAQGLEGAYEDIIGWSLEDVVQLVRGEKGSIVRLQVLAPNDEPGTKPKVVSIVRDKVKLEQQAAQYKILKVKDQQGEHKIGVIDLPTFYFDFAAFQAGDKDFRSTTGDVRKIVAELKKQKVEGIVVDLRSNGGGSLYEAIQLTGLFIEKGPIVQTKSSHGFINVKRDHNPEIIWNGPMVVMVNHISASASEIFAAALQDYGRAVIVGDATFGKGTVQNIVTLNDKAPKVKEELGQLKITNAQFFRINGGSTQNRGVIPDIEFPATPGIENYGESSYENALPWSSIKPGKYTLHGDLTDEIVWLKKRSDARSDVNFEFDFLDKEVALYQKDKDDEYISLSKSERENKQAATKKRREELKQKRKALLQSDAVRHPLLGEVEELYNSAEKDTEKNDKKQLPETTEISKDETKDDQEDELFVDFRLHEAARIIGDLINLQQKKPPAAEKMIKPRKAVRSEEGSVEPL